MNAIYAAELMKSAVPLIARSGLHNGKCLAVGFFGWHGLRVFQHFRYAARAHEGMAEREVKAFPATGKMPPEKISLYEIQRKFNE